MSDYSDYLKSKAFKDIYGDNLNSHTAEIILEYAKEAIRKKPAKIRILDFGSAHCRYFALTEYLERKFPGTKIEYIGFDPYPEGFVDLHQKLVDDGFTCLDCQKNNGEKVIQQYGSFEKGNRKLMLFHANGDVDFTLDKLKEAVGEVDLSFILLGTLSHVETSNRRVDIMKMIGEITNGIILGEVPFLGKAFKEELYEYTLKRLRGENVGKATNLGDFYYDRKLPSGKGIKLFAHAFTQPELLDEINRAGLSSNITTTDSTELTQPLGVITGYGAPVDHTVDPNRDKRTDYLFIACNPAKYKSKSLIPNLSQRKIM